MFMISKMASDRESVKAATKMKIQRIFIRFTVKTVETI